MNFISYPGKIWFEPQKEKQVILNDREVVVEAGMVLGVGQGVTFCKEGDTIFFLAYGAEETPEIDGKTYWTVRDCPEFMMGKIGLTLNEEIEESLKTLDLTGLQDV